MGQRNLKSLCEESSCVFLLTSAICSQRFRKLSLEGQSLDFLSFFLPKMKRGIFFSREQRRVHAAISLLPFIGGLGGVNIEGCVVCWPWLSPRAVWWSSIAWPGLANISGLVIFTHWARLGCIHHGQRGIGLQKCPTGRGERLPVGEKTKSKLNPWHAR